MCTMVHQCSSLPPTTQTTIVFTEDCQHPHFNYHSTLILTLNASSRPLMTHTPSMAALSSSPRIRTLANAYFLSFSMCCIIPDTRLLTINIFFSSLRGAPALLVKVLPEEWNTFCVSLECERLKASKLKELERERESSNEIAALAQSYHSPTAGMQSAIACYINLNRRPAPKQHY